jgi:hypothetical protein
MKTFLCQVRTNFHSVKLTAVEGDGFYLLLVPNCALPTQNGTSLHNTYTLSLWSAPIPESRLSSEYRELSNSEAMESGLVAGPNEEKSPPRT